MSDIRSQIKEINYVRIALEVASISGLIFGVCWAMFSYKGSEIWADKAGTKEALEEFDEELEDARIRDTRYLPKNEARKTYCTKAELRTSHENLEKKTESLKSDFKSFASEQRGVNREILQRLPKD